MKIKLNMTWVIGLGLFLLSVSVSSSRICSVTKHRTAMCFRPREDLQTPPWPRSIKSVEFRGLEVDEIKEYLEDATKIQRVIIHDTRQGSIDRFPSDMFDSVPNLISLQLGTFKHGIVPDGLEEALNGLGVLKKLDFGQNRLPCSCQLPNLIQEQGWSLRDTKRMRPARHCSPENFKRDTYSVAELLKLCAYQKRIRTSVDYVYDESSAEYLEYLDSSSGWVSQDQEDDDSWIEYESSADYSSSSENNIEYHHNQDDVEDHETVPPISRPKFDPRNSKKTRERISRVKPKVNDDDDDDKLEDTVTSQPENDGIFQNKVTSHPVDGKLEDRVTSHHAIDDEKLQDKVTSHPVGDEKFKDTINFRHPKDEKLENKVLSKLLKMLRDKEHNIVRLKQGYLSDNGTF